MTFPIRIDFAITETAYPKLLDFLQSHATTDDGFPHINVTVGWVTTPDTAAELASAEPRMPAVNPWDYLDFEVKASNARFAERLTQNDLLYFQHTLMESCQSRNIAPHVTGLRPLEHLDLAKIHAFCQAMTKGAYAQQERGSFTLYMEYPTPDDAAAAIPTLNEYGLTLADIFLLEEAVSMEQTS